MIALNCSFTNFSNDSFVTGGKLMQFAKYYTLSLFNFITIYVETRVTCLYYQVFIVSYNIYIKHAG